MNRDFLRRFNPNPCLIAILQSWERRDAKQQFLAAQMRGKRERGLQMLDELDALGL